MYNKKVLIDSLKKLGSAKAPTQRKDMIVDPMGQWAHPGENTRIPSSRITMKGVNYPVLGISNTGQKQMMQPGKEYNFPGADYVDEYPQINSRIPKKQLGGLTRFMGSPYKMLGLAPTVSSLFNTAPKINLIAKTIPKLDQSTRDLLTYPAFDVLTGETGIGSASALTKYLGDFDYKPFSEGWETLQDMKNAVDGPQWVPAAEDFYTDQEIVDLVNQQKNYNSALRDFDEMNPEAPGMEIMRALSGDTSRAELFSNLFPNASIPNFRSKILSPEQNASLNRIKLQNRSFQNKAGLSTGSLKTLGVGQDILPKQYNDLLTFYKGLEWLKTTPAKDVVIEMRGLPELKGVDIENASPLQLETWRDTIVKKMEKKAIEKWKNDRGDKLTGLDAYNQLLNRSGGRNQYGGSTDFAEEPSMKKGGSPPKLPRKKNSRGYSRSLEATNRFFAEHSFFAKPKSRKNKIFDPNSRYYQPGGETGCPEGYAFNPKTGECIEWNPTVWNTEDQPTSFDPVADIIYMNPNDRPDGMSDEEYNQMYQDQLEHEQLHRLQWLNDDLQGESKIPLRMPSPADNQEYDGPHYYNRRQEEADYLHNYWKGMHPQEAEFIPDDVIYNNETNPAMYELPWTEEGEARNYEYATRDGMPSFFPKRQKGGELPKAQKGKATYQDSLDVYNNALKQQAFYNKLAPYYGSIRTYSDYSFDIDRAKETQRETLAYKTPNYWTPQEISNFKKTKNIIKANKDPNIAYLTDIITGALDPNAPPLRYDARIKPQGIKSYDPYFAEYTSKELAIIDKINKKGHTSLMSYDGKNFIGTRKEILEKTKKLGYTEKEIIPILSKAKKNNESHDKLKGFITDIPYYDPIAVKPGKLLTDDEIIKRVKKYGTDGIPEDRLKKLTIKDRPPSQPKIKINPEEVGTFVSKKQPCVPKTTVVNNVPEKIPFGKKLVGTTSTTSPVTSTNKCEYIETINPVYENIKVERMDPPQPQLVTEDPMGSIQGIQADPLVPPQYIMEDYKADRPDINIDWSNQKSIDYNLPKYHKNWMQTAAPPFHGTKKHSIEYKLPTGLDISNKEKTKLIPKLVQKLTGYDPEYMEGYEDEEGNYIPGAIELANQTGSELEFKGAASLRDFINQQQYKKDYAVYQEGLDKRNQDKRMAETLAKMYAKYKQGGYLPKAQYGDAMNAMMKARLAYANEFGNPAAKRMIVVPDQPYDFGNGMTGTHYMASMDNYAVPQIQDENGQLTLGNYGPESNEAVRFDSDEDANYFAEHYKDVSPGFMDIELDEADIDKYVKGGYIIEDISIPSLTRMKEGGPKGCPPNCGGLIKGVGRMVDAAKTIDKLHVDDFSNLTNILKNNFAYPLTIEGGSGYMKLVPNDRGNIPQNLWHIQTEMTDPREAGKAFHMLNQILPPNPSLLETDSLSLDSFSNLLNMGRRKDWDVAYENDIPLNSLHQHSQLFKGLDVPSTLLGINDFTADHMVGRLNDFIRSKGFEDEAYRISPPGASNMNRIYLPNYKITRKWEDGGALPKAQTGGLLSLLKPTTQSISSLLKSGNVIKPASLLKTMQLPLVSSQHTFVPEIDKSVWAKWNKATPDFSKLMQEYKDIEEFTKGSGTWMKNPDGSPYLGMPQQFIQEQSENFKKSFPEGFNEVFRGVNKKNAFANFDMGRKYSGPRSMFAGNFDMGNHYAMHHTGLDENLMLNPFVRDNTGGVYHLVHPKGKHVIYNSGLDGWQNIGKGIEDFNADAKLEDLEIDLTKQYLETRLQAITALQKTSPQHNKNYINDEIKDLKNRIEILNNPELNSKRIMSGTDLGELEKLNSAIRSNLYPRYAHEVPGERITTNTIARALPNTDLNSVILQNISDGGLGDVTIVNNRPGNYLKSRVGNTGFFKMDNPNIYKGLVPLAVGAGAGALLNNPYQEQSPIGKYQGGGARKAIKTLSNFLSKEKSFVKPIVNDLNYKPGLIEIRNFALPGMPEIDKPYELYSIDLPDRLIPGRDYEDVKHKLSGLRRDLKIPYLEHLANKYIPGFAKEIPMREAASSVHPTTGQLWDSNTRYWLNRQYGITPEIGFTDLGMATRMAKNYGTLITKSDKPFGTGHNYVHTLPGPAVPIRIHNPYNVTLSNPFTDKSPIDDYKNGGQYELGDEIDEVTMKELKKLGYTFEKI